MKKALILAAAVLAVFLLAMAAHAEPEIVDSGACGENLTWTLDSDGLLTISGSGPMDNYGDYDDNWNYYGHP